MNNHFTRKALDSKTDRSLIKNKRSEPMRLLAVGIQHGPGFARFGVFYSAKVPENNSSFWCLICS